VAKLSVASSSDFTRPLLCKKSDVSPNTLVIVGLIHKVDAQSGITKKQDLPFRADKVAIDTREAYYMRQANSMATLTP